MLFASWLQLLFVGPLKKALAGGYWKDDCYLANSVHCHVFNLIAWLHLWCCQSWNLGRNIALCAVGIFISSTSSWASQLLQLGNYKPFEIVVVALKVLDVILIQSSLKHSTVSLISPEEQRCFQNHSSPVLSFHCVCQGGTSSSLPLSPIDLLLQKTEFYWPPSSNVTIHPVQEWEPFLTGKSGWCRQ